MQDRKVKLAAKYEAPRLQTYGTLQQLTKGALSGSIDDLITKPAPGA